MNAWIKCTYYDKDLPKDSKDVLVYLEDKKEIVKAFMLRRWRYSHNREIITDYISHWMPLPEPPTSEE